MDYGIIFLIIIVIIIIIAIILIIYANRTNTLNLLLTLPNYRIQNVATCGYLGLINFPRFLTEDIGSIPIYTLSSNPFLSFWLPLVGSDLTATDPFGLWKIDIIKQINVTVAEVKIINDVYFTESPGLSAGFLGPSPPGGLRSTKFTPTYREDAEFLSIFIMTTIAPNTFTLTLKNGNLPIITDSSNLLTFSRNLNIKPLTFKLTLV